MPRFTINEFSGMNSEIPLMDLPPGAMGPLSKDVYVSRSGHAIQARAGDLAVSLVGDTYPNVVSMFPTRQQKMIVAYDSGATLAMVQGSFDKIPLAAGLAVAPWRFAEGPPAGGLAGTLAYGVNGTNSLQIAAGVTGAWTASAGTFPAGARLITYAANRMMLAGMTALAGAVDPLSVVTASAIGNPRDWSVANGAWAVELGPGDGEFVTQIVFHNDYVYVFKPSRTWVIYDLDTGANRLLSARVGCPINNGVGAVSTPHGLAFLSRDQGVIVTDGGSLQSISGDVISKHGFGQTDNNVHLAFAGDQLMMTRSAVAGVGVGYRYDFPMKAWSAHTISSLADSNVVAAWSPDGSAERFYMSRSRIFRLFEPGQVNDLNAQPLLATYRSGPLLPGDGRRRRFRSVRLFGQGLANPALIQPAAAALSGATQIDGKIVAVAPNTGELSEAYIRHITGVHSSVAVYLQLNAEGVLTSIEGDTQERAR